jgi:tetratricopeptide (TPR) repeat protein
VKSFWKRWFSPTARPADPLSRGGAALAAGSEAAGEHEALALLASVAGAEPNNGDSQLALGMLRLAEFRRDAAPATLNAAVNHLERAVALLPDSPEAHFYLALGESFTLATADAAAAHLEQALRLDPGLAERADEIRERVTAAHVGLQQQAIDPATLQSAVRLYDAAQAEIRAGALAAALPLLVDAVAQYPAYVEALLALSDVYRELGRGDEAIATLRRALSVRPQLFGAHLALGSLYVGRGEHGRALEQLEQALAQQPEHPQVLRNVGLLQLATGKPALAVATFRRLCALQPDDPDPRLQLALASLQAGDDAAAVAALERVDAAQLSARQRMLAARVAADLGSPDLSARFPADAQ